MAITVSDPGGSREPIEAGTHPAVCIGLFDIGTQASANSMYPAKRKVVVQWEFPELTYEYEGQEMRRVTSAFYTLSLAEKANLRKDLDAWRGRPFTSDELRGFHLNKILGASCLLTILHEERGGQIRDRVSRVTALPRSMPKYAPSRDLIEFDLDEVLATDRDIVWPDGMPSWVRDMVLKSEEYRARFGDDGGGGSSGFDDAPPPPDDDDIPF